MAEDANWEILSSIPDIEKVIEQNKQYFTSNGRDCQTILQKSKIYSSDRQFGNIGGSKKVITVDDIKLAIEEHKANSDITVQDKLYNSNWII